MPHIPRHAFLALISAVSMMVVIAFVFTLHRMSNGGEVLGGVVVSGVDIGGLRMNEALARLGELEEEVRKTAIPVVVGAATFELELAAIDYTIDRQTIVDEAMANGRQGNVAGQFAWWLSHLFSGPSELSLLYSYDADALDEIVRVWEVEGMADPPFPGEIWVVNGEVLYRYPAVGTGIDRERAIALISESLAGSIAPPVELPTRLLLPLVTPEDVDRAVEETRRLIDGDVVLANEQVGKEVVIPSDVLSLALAITVDAASPDPEFTFSLRDEVFIEYLDGFSDFLEIEPVDAEIIIDVEDDTVTLVPSIPAHDVDDDVLADAVWAAMTAPGRMGEIPYAVGDEAEFSTADAEALGIKELIGEFTTHHPCCQARVRNIQLMADAVDGALVMPGETFSLNDRVGQRTTEKGYVCAGALVGGELVEEGQVCIGGGTSQFTTTLHNAVFFAGLEHVRFTPHSAWFSRYPEGREATIGWREPAYIFRNDTDSALIIRTTYTGSSITVKIYGDNGGREVTAGLSNRYNFTPVVQRTRINSDIRNGSACTVAERNQVQSGHGGWSVTVYRYITWPDGEETTEEWHWHYTGLYRIYEWNPNDPNCVEEEEEEENGNGNGNGE
jgi:vancomycin resistance protein YoaR